MRICRYIYVAIKTTNEPNEIYSERKCSRAKDMPNDIEGSSYMAFLILDWRFAFTLAISHRMRNICLFYSSHSIFVMSVTVKMWPVLVNDFSLAVEFFLV